MDDNGEGRAPRWTPPRTRAEEVRQVRVQAFEVLRLVGGHARDAARQDLLHHRGPQLLHVGPQLLRLGELPPDGAVPRIDAAELALHVRVPAHEEVELGEAAWLCVGSIDWVWGRGVFR